jgi:hypothetical protein
MNASPSADEAALGAGALKALISRQFTSLGNWAKTSLEPSGASAGWQFAPSLDVLLFVIWVVAPPPAGTVNRYYGVEGAHPSMVGQRRNAIVPPSGE